MVREVPKPTEEEVEKARKVMERGRAAEDDVIMVDLRKNGGYTGLGKLAKLFAKFHSTIKVRLALKNAKPTTRVMSQNLRITDPLIM